MQNGGLPSRERALGHMQHISHSWATQHWYIIWKDCTKDLTGVDEPACINITFKYPFTIHVCDLLPVLDLAIFTMSLVMLCYTLTEICQCHNRRLGCIPGVYKHQTQLLQVPELDLG